MTHNDIIFKTIPGCEAADLVNSFYAKNGWHTSKARDIDTFAIAFNRGQVVGSVRICMEHGVYMLRTMMIEVSFRKDGLGSRLLKYYEDNLLKDIGQDVLCTPYDHLGKFYNLIGFQEASINTAPQFIQERIAEYTAKGNPCLFMVRKK